MRDYVIKVIAPFFPQIVVRNTHDDTGPTCLAERLWLFHINNIFYCIKDPCIPAADMLRLCCMP